MSKTSLAASAAPDPFSLEEDDHEARLPKWAQTRLKLLRRGMKEAQERAASVTGELPKRTDFFVEHSNRFPHGDGRPLLQPLRKGSTVVWCPGERPEKDCTVEMRTIEDSDSPGGFKLQLLGYYTRKRGLRIASGGSSNVLFVEIG